MKRKITTVFFVTLLLSCAVIGLCACKKTCNHTYSKWNEIKAATCTENGEKMRICTKCENTETQIIDALGHNYSEEWINDENGHCHECTNTGCSEKINEASHKDENNDHKCDDCEYAMSEHTYGETQYIWNEDYTECTAYRTCTYCTDETEGHMQVINATINYKIEQNANCLLPELTKYTATFIEDWAMTQTKENVVTGNATGHNPSIDWINDENGHWYECTNTGCSEKINEASHKDENNDHKCDDCEYAMSSHTYGETQYIWNEDYTECTAYRTCTYCTDETEGHMQVVNATDITSEVTQEISCENPEKTTYTATFDGITWTKTHVEEIETAAKLGHDFTGSYYFSLNAHWFLCKRINCNATSTEVAHTDENHDHKCDLCKFNYSTHSYSNDYVYEWNDDYTKCTLMRICSYCTEETEGHTQSVTTTNITNTIKQNASCESPEITTYKSNFDGLSKWADYHDKTIDVETSPKLGHEYQWDLNDSEHWQFCKREGCETTTEKDVHSDNNNDHLCDFCNRILSKCADENNDHFCDLCEKRITYCKDEDGDQFCDICGTACKDSDNDHYCDDCGNQLTECVDEDKNHVCDICKGTVGEHKQADGKHYCAYCDETTSKCADNDNDHKCDVCGKILSYHTYGEVVYTWHGDYTSYTSCTASKTCTYCTEETEGHTVYGYSTDIKAVKNDPNCLVTGSIQYHATFDVDWASKTETFEIPALGHDIDDEWSYNSSSHWHECLNGCEGIFNGGEHSYESGICTVCGCYDVYGTEGLKFNYYQGKYHVIGYTGTATEVKIPYYYNNGIDGYELVVSIVDAFNGNSHITSVIIPNSVTAIADYAFCNCSNLVTVEVGNNLTTIGGNAFYGCASLATIDLGQNLISVGNSAFGNCTALTKIDLGEKLTSISTKAFYGCISLTEFRLPSTITDFGKGILMNCNNLTKVTYPANIGVIGYLFGESSSYEKNADNLPKSLTEVVINGGDSLCYGAFYGCTFIKTITISSVENIGSYVFTGCNGLRKVEFLSEIKTIPSGTLADLPSLTTVVLPTSLTSIGSSTFSNCSELITVEIPGNLTDIGNGAFYNCTSLNKVVIPSGVTSILNDTFSGCTSLTSVEIKGNINIIGNSAFSGCTSLTSVEIKGSIKTIGNSAFSGCSLLSNITIPETITNIGSNAFYNTKITKIIIPDNVTIIGDNAFANCTSLKTVVIHPNVTSLGTTILKDCTDVTDLTYSLSYGGLSALFGSTSYSNLSSICINGGDNIPEKAFQNCTSITKLEITCQVTSIGDYAFQGCSKLTTIKVTGDITSIGNYAFKDCFSLTEAPLPSTLTSIGNYAFSNCSSFTSIVIPEGVTNIGSSAFEYCLALMTVTLPSTLTTIPDKIFYNCSELVNISIPNTITSIGNSSFYKCLKLENISISNTITSIGKDAFMSCTSLKYNEYDNACYLGNDENPYVVLIKASNNDIQSCKIHEDTKIIYYQAFKDCTLLTNIEIAKNVISIGVQTFYNCSALENIMVSIDNPKYSGIGNAIVETNTKTLIIGSENTVIPNDGSVTSISDYAFYKNTKITSLVIPDSILSIGKYAFNYCTSLTEITLSKNLTSIGELAFSGCTSLKSVTIPGSVETWGPGAFYKCTSLTTVVIEEGVTSLGLSSNIGEFQECTSLVSVTLPSTLTYIGHQTFRDCRSLTSIVIPKNITEIARNAFIYCYMLVEVYNLSALNITVGNIDNGAVGFYAKVVHMSLDEESTIKKVNDFVFVTINNVNYLIGYTGTLTEITSPYNYNGESYVINDYAFFGCTSLQSIVISNGVTSIGNYAFSGCTSLQSIVIFDSIISISNYAFGGCKILKKVYYTSTANEWNGVDIASGNTSLTSSTIYYYSATEPTDEGNYWYYDKNKTVVIW